MKKLIISLVLFPAIFVLSACTSNTGQERSEDGKNKVVDSIVEPVVSPNTTTTYISLVEVAKHNSAENCWTSISGNVFDITNYVKSGLHPGGDKILNACGVEATEMFNSIPKHGDKARGNLDASFIGKLQ